MLFFHFLLQSKFIFSSQREIISALPKLIKLSQPVVKEVFNRLLGLNGTYLPSSSFSQQFRFYLSAASEVAHASPILPSELLIALHQISSDECDLKITMNGKSFDNQSIFEKFFSDDFSSDNFMSQ